MSSETAKSALYERLGGVYSIAAVVDDFIDRVMHNMSCFRIKGRFLKQSNDWHTAPRLALRAIGCHGQHT
jgi:hypothetical protein